MQKLSRRLLEKMGFVNTECSIIQSKGAKFNILSIERDKKLNPKKEPGVYMWVSKKQDIYTVRYIGKAGNGLRNRIKQHEAGYKRHGSIKLDKCLDDNHLLEIWFKISDYKKSNIYNIFKKTSLFSFEEEILILEYAKTIFNKIPKYMTLPNKE